VSNKKVVFVELLNPATEEALQVHALSRGRGALPSFSSHWLRVARESSGIVELLQGDTIAWPGATDKTRIAEREARHAALML